MMGVFQKRVEWAKESEQWTLVEKIFDLKENG